MLSHIAPGCERLFVAPELQGQEFSRGVQALEPFDGNEAVDLVEQRAQRGCGVEILLTLALGWKHFKNDRDHERLTGGTVW